MAFRKSEYANGNEVKCWTIRKFSAYAMPRSAIDPAVTELLVKFSNVKEAAEIIL